MKFILNGPFKPFPSLKQEPPITDFKSFWNWFVKHEARFRQMLNISYKDDCEFNAIFLERLLQVWRECAFTAQKNQNGEYEIVFNISNQLRRAVVAEEVAAAAPILDKWRFSAFTKPIENAEYKAEFGGVWIDCKEVFFFSTQHADRPDMVDITVTFKKYDEIYHERVKAVCKKFIEHIVGELEMLTQFDKLEIRPAAAGDPELIPLAKLPAFLRWRETEFVEKYKGVYYDKKAERGDRFLLLQSKPTSKGLFSITTADRFVMRWNETASYPWMLCITLAFEGKKDGQPDEKTRIAISSFQKDLLNLLEPHEGYLFLLHDTFNGVNTTYIACNEFRKIITMTENFLKKYDDHFQLGYAINLDKYWSIVDMYKPACLQM